MRIKTPSTSSSCTNNTFVTNELFSLELHQEPATMILEQDCRFQTTTTFWLACIAGAAAKTLISHPHNTASYAGYLLACMQA